MCLKLNIYQGRSLYLQILFDVTRIGIHWRFFGHNLISKFQYTGRKGLKTLPNSVIDLFMRVL